MNRTTFMYVFIISSMLFFVGGIVFFAKVSQEELNAGLEVVKTEVGGPA